VKHSILIVEDAYPNRFVLEQLLEEYECQFAVDGCQMWEKLSAHIPDLIIMDIGLPREDGLILAQKLQKDDRYRGIPVIFLTAHSSKKEIVTGMLAGAYDYLVKPIDGTILLERIDAVLKRKVREQHGGAR